MPAEAVRAPDAAAARCAGRPRSAPGAALAGGVRERARAAPAPTATPEEEAAGAAFGPAAPAAALSGS